MAIYTARVYKSDGGAMAEVSVEVCRSVGLQVSCQLLAPIHVQALHDEPLVSAELEASCISGGRSAGELFELVDSKIVVRAIKGRISPWDMEGFAIATLLATGRALRRDDAILQSALTGVGGSWTLARRRPHGRIAAAAAAAMRCAP